MPNKARELSGTPAREATMPEVEVDRRVRRTRRILLDAFIALVLERGYDGLTVQDILDRADVGRSTFYAHYRDKETLLLSCFDGVRGDLTAAFAAGAPDPAAVVFAHAHAHRDVYKVLCGRPFQKDVDQEDADIASI